METRKPRGRGTKDEKLEQNAQGPWDATEGVTSVRWDSRGEARGKAPDIPEAGVAENPLNHHPTPIRSPRGSENASSVECKTQSRLARCVQTAENQRPSEP